MSLKIYLIAGLIISGCANASTDIPCLSIEVSNYKKMTDLSSLDGLPRKTLESMQDSFKKCLSEGNAVCIVGFRMVGDIRKPLQWRSKNLLAPIESKFDIDVELTLGAVQSMKVLNGDSTSVCILGRNLFFRATPWSVKAWTIVNGKNINYKELSYEGKFTTVMTPASLSKEMLKAYRSK